MCLDNFKFDECKKSVKKFCETLVQQSEPITKFQHYNNIEELVKCGLKVWAAQKVLSVIIKLYWCIGKIPQPEVCPIDRIVIIGGCKIPGVNWTEINDMQTYMRIFEQVVEISDSKDGVANWELRLWNKK